MAISKQDSKKEREKIKGIAHLQGALYGVCYDEEALRVWLECYRPPRFSRGQIQCSLQGVCPLRWWPVLPENSGKRARYLIVSLLGEGNGFLDRLLQLYRYRDGLWLFEAPEGQSRPLINWQALLSQEGNGIFLEQVRQYGERALVVEEIQKGTVLLELSQRPLKIHRLSYQGRSLHMVHISPDQRWIVGNISYSTDPDKGEVGILDMRTKQPTELIYSYPSYMFWGVLAISEHYIVTGHEDGTINFWPLPH